MLRTTRVSSSPASPLALAVALALGAGGAGTAYAENEANDSGPYVGGGFGQFDVKIDDLEGVQDVLGDLDADDSAWKLFFGWRFNRFFSLEADYIDLGAPRGDFDASGSSAAYAVGTLPLGIFELSAKAGYYFHDVELHVDFDNIGPNNGDVFDSDDSGEAPVFGVGAGVTFLDHINAKLEYELYDLDEADDAYALWLTGSWRF
jgi:hypothetical protein